MCRILPLHFRSLVIRLMVVYDEIAVESKRLPWTYVVGRTRKKMAPQKVKPSPMNAKTWEFSIIDMMSDSIPGMVNATPILSAKPMRFSFLKLKFSASECELSVLT